MPPKSKTLPQRGGKKKKEIVSENFSNMSATFAAPAQDEEDMYKETVKRIVRPPNQLQLAPEKLIEEYTRVLTANDPNIPNNITKYNYKDKVYKQDPEGEMMLILVDIEGIYVKSIWKRLSNTSTLNQLFV
jgi:dynein intermediate chain 1